MVCSRAAGKREGDKETHPHHTPSMPKSLEQNVKPFLCEVVIVGEDIRKSMLAHGLHGNTVGQAVFLIGPGFIERQGIEKGGARLWDDNPQWMVECLPDST